MGSPATRDGLLAAAEGLFLANGYDRVSVRAICAAADANPAAVHYHFGSKEQLVTELLEARLAPLWTDPLDTFDAGSQGVPDLVRRVLTPFLEIQGEPLGRLHLQLLNRFVHAHPTASWTRPWFQLDRWSGLLAELVDGLEPADAARRWTFAFQLILVCFGDDHRLSDNAVDALAGFVVAGLAAPATTSASTVLSKEAVESCPRSPIPSHRPPSAHSRCATGSSSAPPSRG